VTSDSDYSIYQSNVVDSELTVTGLTPGTYYDFKVEARSLVGFSAFSDAITVLAAQIPDEPTDLANVPANTFAT